MLEAMWALKFGRFAANDGAGVMVLETGRVFGGDSSFSFIGKYEVSGDTLTARFHVKRHASMLQNIFGIDEFDMTLTGKVDAKVLRLDGSIDGQPGATLVVVATRVAELP